VTSAARDNCGRAWRSRRGCSLCHQLGRRHNARGSHALHDKRCSDRCDGGQRCRGGCRFCWRIWHRDRSTLCSRVRGGVGRCPAATILGVRQPSELVLQLMKRNIVLVLIFAQSPLQAPGEPWSRRDGDLLPNWEIPDRAGTTSTPSPAAPPAAAPPARRRPASRRPSPPW
jgi:hypothetical protein